MYLKLSMNLTILFLTILNQYQKSVCLYRIKSLTPTVTVMQRMTMNLSFMMTMRVTMNFSFRMETMETGVWMTNHMIVIQGIQGRQTMHSPTVQLWSATVTVTMILDTRTWTRTTRTWELQYPQPHHHQVQKICRAQPDQLCQCLLHPCRRPQNRWWQGSCTTQKTGGTRDQTIPRRFNVESFDCLGWQHQFYWKIGPISDLFGMFSFIALMCSFIIWIYCVGLWCFFFSANIIPMPITPLRQDLSTSNVLFMAQNPAVAASSLVAVVAMTPTSEHWCIGLSKALHITHLFTTYHIYMALRSLTDVLCVVCMMIVWHYSYHPVSHLARFRYATGTWGDTGGHSSQACSQCGDLIAYNSLFLVMVTQCSVNYSTTTAGRNMPRWFHPNFLHGKSWRNSSPFTWPPRDWCDVDVQIMSTFLGSLRPVHWNSRWDGMARKRKNNKRTLMEMNPELTSWHWRDMICKIYSCKVKSWESQCMGWDGGWMVSMVCPEKNTNIVFKVVGRISWFCKQPFVPRTLCHLLASTCS